MNNIKPTVSLVTTCKGRLEYLKKTLPRNLSTSPENTRFIIVDYDCPEKTFDWVNQLKDERVECLRVLDAPPFFHHTHSINIGMLYAKSDIVCKVDADNFTGEGFVEFLLDNCDKDIIAYAPKIRYTKFRGSCGRVTLFKSDFVKIGGYDEDFCDWSHDDQEIKKRALRNGLKRILIPKVFLDGISNEKKEKIKFSKDKNWKRNLFAGRVIEKKSNESKRKKANEGRPWGKARVLIKEDITDISSEMFQS